jgi:hypothetical protein
MRLLDYCRSDRVERGGYRRDIRSTTLREIVLAAASTAEDRGREFRERPG